MQKQRLFSQLTIAAGNSQHTWADFIFRPTPLRIELHTAPLVSVSNTMGKEKLTAANQNTLVLLQQLTDHI